MLLFEAQGEVDAFLLLRSDVHWKAPCFLVFFACYFLYLWACYWCSSLAKSLITSIRSPQQATTTPADHFSPELVTVLEAITRGLPSLQITLRFL